MSILDNPDSKETQEFMSRCLHTHLITGQSMDVLLGLKQEYTAPTARTRYWRMKCGLIIYDIYKQLILDGHSNAVSARLLFSWINETRQPPIDYCFEIQEVLYINTLIPMKITSEEAFIKRMQRLENAVNTLLVNLYLDNLDNQDL